MIVLVVMPRHKYKESKRAVDVDGIVVAVKEVMVEKKAIRPVAVAYKIDRITLIRYMSKVRRQRISIMHMCTDTPILWHSYTRNLMRSGQRKRGSRRRGKQRWLQNPKSAIIVLVPWQRQLTLFQVLKVLKSTRNVSALSARAVKAEGFESNQLNSLQCLRSTCALEMRQHNNWLLHLYSLRIRLIFFFVSYLFNLEIH